MPQTSISFACGRVGVLRRSALKRVQLDRLLSAHDGSEAVRTLSDIGFSTADDADFQAAAEKHVLKACELIKAVTTDATVTDCFFLRYDVHNLKILLKSRQLAQKPQYLSACGSLNVDKLSHCVAEHTYTSLPSELRAAMESLEKRGASKFDPMLVDTELDKAMYRQIFVNLAKSPQSDEITRYFKAKADLQNVVMLLRLRAMGRETSEFLSLALPGGQLNPQTLVKNCLECEKLARMLRLYGNKVYQAAQAAATDAGKLPFFEKTADDYLYGLFETHRYDSASLEMLIVYLLQKQREATDVRLILAGKLNGFSPEEIAERMRELDG
jgi:V/A-type H+/Na+-transporting ATPase subunit C